MAPPEEKPKALRHDTPQTAPIAVVRVVSGNRVTLPSKVTGRLGVAVGDELLLIEDKRGYLLTPPVVEMDSPSIDG